MTDAELGFYHRCLNHSWINSGLPCDLDELARAMRVTRAYLDKIWKRVGKRFECLEGKLVNRRQELERAHATSKSERATASVRTRYERSYERSTNDLPRARARPGSESDSGFGSNDLHKENARASPVVVDSEDSGTDDPQFARIITAFLAAGVILSEPHVEAAAAEWRGIPMALRYGAPEAAEQRAVDHEARFMGLPASWLRKREWTARGPGRILPAPPGKSELATREAAKRFEQNRGKRSF
jgi:hypothetical protein